MNEFLSLSNFSQSTADKFSQLFLFIRLSRDILHCSKEKYCQLTLVKMKEIDTKW